MTQEGTQGDRTAPTRDDAAAFVGKLQEFAAGLTPAEQVLFRSVLRTPDATPGDEEVRGYDFWGGLAAPFVEAGEAVGDLLFGSSSSGVKVTQQDGWTIRDHRHS